MENKNLNKFFNPESIAIVGATDGEGKVGRMVTENIFNLGYKGEVFLVNPNRKELFGKKCYATLESIKDNIDLAIVIVPAKFVNDIVKNGLDKTKNFVIISAGFSETGEEGKKREEELSQLAKEKNLTILGPNCLGFIIPKLKLNATFSGGMPGFGNIGFITQSGALAVAILDIFEKEHLGFSGVFSIGNKVRIDEADLIEYLGNDPGTKVVGLYLEGIKNGSRFMEMAERVSRVKPIVILKAGKTERSQKAITLHTGALAGSDDITHAVFKKCGIIRAENLEKFINILRLISLAKVSQNNLVAVVTNAGGAGVLTTDIFKNKTITLAELSEATKSKLRSVLPEESSVENPIDVLGDSQEDR
ncbi:MAG: CoA-binding protein, partial [Candidatus Moranbacteria bacterium]|nr:CoA-binding protein [Candidatus Moranbacteria bacterium]